MSVFVLDKRKQPLMPCSEKRARQLLERSKAVVHRLHPFTIRLRGRIGGVMQSLEVRVDPGSKSTGIALVRRCDDGTDKVLHLAQVDHRGALISKKLSQRAGFRRRRRSANLRYRAPRFNNRTKPKGWLAPSLRHRVVTTASYVAKLHRFSPVTSRAMELVRFDMQLMQTPEISGVEYQQGALAGYEVREYLLEKWGRNCAYCDGKNIPLQVEHIVPRAAGGSNRITNLTLACGPCNMRKAALPLATFLANDPVRLARIQKQAKASLRDAAAVNSTRWALLNTLTDRFGAVSAWSGGRTKWNRSRFDVSKSHALDAACVGDLAGLTGWNVPTLQVRAMGRGSHQRTRLDSFGFPRGHLMRTKSVHGFRTGDMVTADVPKGLKAGSWCGRVAVRATGSFNILTQTGLVQGISHRHCRLTQRSDGYGYGQLQRGDNR